MRRHSIGAALPVALALGLCATAARPQPSGDFTDQPGLPAGPRGERARLLIEAVASGAAARLEAAVEAAFAASLRERAPLQEHLDELAGIHDRSQGYDVHGVRTPAAVPNGLTVIVRNRLTGGFEAFILEYDAEDRIRGFEVRPARPPRDLPLPPPLDAAAAVAELEAFIQRLARAEAFSGTVVLAKDGKVHLHMAVGLADRNHDVAMARDSKLNLGSMNKMFTAVAAARLVEQGKLRFEDPVSRWLAGEQWTRADLTKVRLEHLLTHSSGLGSYFNEVYRRSARQLFRRLADYKPLVADDTLAFEPGSRSQYSNTGFLLAGAMLEKAAGRDYFELVRELVYGPAGMKDSDCYDVDIAVPKLAIGYSPERVGEARRWRANTFEHVIRGGPAGGGYSTAADLLAFAEALRSGRLVGRPSLERLWSGKPELSSPGYGYGFVLEGRGPGRIVGHGGGFPGINSNLDIFPETGWVAVVLANLDRGADPVVMKIRELVARVSHGRGSPAAGPAGPAGPAGS